MCKQIILVISGLLFLNSSMAQAIKMGDPFANKESSAKNLGRNNIYQLQQAEIQFQAFDEQETLFALDNAVAQNPFSANALVRRAKYKQILGMDTEAQEDIRRAKMLNPFIVDLLGVGNPYSIMNVMSINPEGGFAALPSERRIDYYYNALDDAYVDDDKSIKELEWLEMAVLSIEKEELINAEKWLDSIIFLFPKSAIAYDLKGVLAMKEGEYEAAVSHFETAISIEPDFAIAWFNYGRVEELIGNQATAIKYFNKSLELESNLTKAYFERALLKKKNGETAEALEDYDKIINLKGEDYLEAYLNRGLTKKMLGDFSGALNDLDYVINEDANNPHVYKNRGNLYMVFGYHNKAIDDYSKAISLDPDLSEAYYNRGLAHFLRLDNVSACRDLTTSEELGFVKATEKIKYICVE